MVFVSLILICTACIRDNSEEGTFILKSGDKLPAFSITLNNGLEVTNEEFRGKVSLIVFFNTGCPDCRKELPVIQEVYEYFKEYDDIKVLAISREQGYNDVCQYWASNDLSVPFSAQDERYVYDKFSENGIPLIFIINKNLVIYKVWKENECPDKYQIICTIESVNDFLKKLTIYNISTMK